MSSQKILQLLANTSMADKALRYAFNQIDKDKNGFINPQEFELVIQQFATHTGIPTPPSFIIRQSIKVFDTNRDGVISYDEFKVFAYETLKLQAQHQDPNHPSYQQNQGSNQYGTQNQGGHLPSNVQGLGQGRDAYPGGNQYQGQQAPYQNTNQPQGMQGQYQGGQYQTQNIQGQGQYPGGNQYQQMQGQYQGTNQPQGMPGQYQGGQYQTQNVQGGQTNANYAPNIQVLGQGRDAYPGGNQYQGQQVPYQGTNQPQGMPGQYQGGQYQMQNVQGQGQGRDAYQGGNQYREMPGQYQGGQHQTQNVQGGQINEHLPSNAQGIGQGRDAYQNQYGNYSAY